MDPTRNCGNKFFNICVLISMINCPFRICILLHIKRHSCAFLLVFKIVESFQFILNEEISKAPHDEIIFI